MATGASDECSPVVDLEELRVACGPVVALYRRFLEGGRLQLDVDELDVALTEMRRLPPLGGRIGSALALVASGGAQASTEEVLAALDLLSAALGLQAAGDLPCGFEGLARAMSFAQPPLPGMG